MFFKLGPKTSQVPIAVLVPNIITTLSLCSGLASIHFALIEKWGPAVASIALAMVFDALDGRAARLLHVSSKFGAVLDSLSDFVSFGVAPAIILHEWLLKPAVTPFELSGVMIYALCAGMRLARFTAAVPGSKPATYSPRSAPSAPPPLPPLPPLTPDTFQSSPSPQPTPPPASTATNYFSGMPTPAAAAAVMIPALVNLSGVFTWQFPQWSIVALALVIGLLMVSRVPTFAFKKLSINRRLIVPMLLLIGLTVVSLVTHFWLTLAILATFNFCLTPFSWFIRWRAKAAEEGTKITNDEAA